ncbi:MAG: PepSY domain-containing protein [Fimbriimonadaceae bacterium]
MYRATRVAHKWVGVVVAVFLAIIAVTGILLAMKASVDWIRPPESSGGDYESLSEVVSVHEAAEAAFALGDSRLASVKDIDRIDYRPRRNVYKILSREGYLEVQVDGATGEVLQTAYRTDQMTEDIHDLSFFSDLLHQYWLPVVGLALAGLSISGTVMFFVPVFRRRKNAAVIKAAKKSRAKPADD